MMKKVSERELKQAATVLWEEWKTFLETIEPHDPSPEFDARMHHLIEQKQQEIKLREKEKKRRIRHRVAVAAVLVLAILLGWLLIDQTAYAKVSKWFKSIVGNTVKFDFSGDFHSVGNELPAFRLGWFPEGGEVVYENMDMAQKSYTIVLAYSGEVKIGFQYSFMHDGLAISYSDLEGKERITEIFQCGENRIEGYLDPEDIENDYFWVDEQRNLSFSLTSFLPHETNKQIIEQIYLQAD